MLTRKYLESQPNWQATYHNTRNGRFFCLMRTVKAGYYVHTADHEGVAWGATWEFLPRSFRHAITAGLLALASGIAPKELAA